MPSYYPIYLNLDGKRCMVFGGGPVAEGKITELCESGAKITVISPEVTPGIQRSAHSGRVDWQAREFEPGDLDGVFLDIAATNLRGINQQIYQEAQRLGVLLNVVDAPNQCTFIAPSVVKRGQVTLAISTGGTSPALARKLRETLAADPALHWADLAGVLSQARQEVKAQKAAIDPQRWQCCLTPELLDLAQSGQEEAALSKLLSELLDGTAPGLCPQVNQCSPQGCGTKPKERER